jgi:hypothetical protein
MSSSITELIFLQATKPKGQAVGFEKATVLRHKKSAHQESIRREMHVHIGATTTTVKGVI